MKIISLSLILLVSTQAMGSGNAQRAAAAAASPAQSSASAQSSAVAAAMFLSDSQSGNDRIHTLWPTLQEVAQNVIIDAARNSARQQSKDQLKRHFFTCAQHGKIEEVNALLETGNVNVNATVDNTGERGRTALFAAAFNGHGAVVKRLLSVKSCIVDCADEQTVTPLFVACLNGHTAVIRLLLDAGASVHKADKTGKTPLYVACQNGNIENIDLLLAKGAEVNRETKVGANCLFIAALEGKTAVVKRLLQVPGIKIDNEDECGCTPLLKAFNGNNEEIVGMLLMAGADAKKRYKSSTSNKRNCTLLYNAASCDNAQMVDLLLPYSDVNQMVNDYTPLCDAAVRGYTEIVKRLLAVPGIEVDKLSQGITPLIAAVTNGYVSTVAALLAAGADPCLVEPEKNRTPLHIAAWNGNTAMVELLLMCPRTNIDQEDSAGKTALNYAAQRKHADIVRILLAKSTLKAAQAKK